MKEGSILQETFELFRNMVCGNTSLELLKQGFEIAEVSILAINGCGLWIPTMSCLTSQCFENALLPAAPLCYGIGQVDKRTVLADGVWYVVCEISGIKVLKLDTYQGRLSPSPNHCTIIAPLIVASCLQEAKSFLWS